MGGGGAQGLGGGGGLVDRGKRSVCVSSEDATGSIVRSFEDCFFFLLEFVLFLLLFLCVCFRSLPSIYIKFRKLRSLRYPRMVFSFFLRQFVWRM